MSGAESGGSTPSPAWIELRVHGVSGTPPESSLLCDHVVQVAGDTRGQFFRPADSWHRPVPGTDGQLLEAYHWGHYTSGSKLQGLWVLLLPFGLVNAAQFMLPPPGSTLARLWHGLSGACLRIVSLALSCVLILGVAVVAMDLIGWQWVGAGYDHHYGNLAWAAALPLSALLVFTRIGGQSGSGQLPASRAADDPAPPTPLASVQFYDGDVRAIPLRALHSAAAIAMVAALTVWPAATIDTGARHVRFAAMAVLIAVAVVTLFSGDLTKSASMSLGWLVTGVHKVATVLAWVLLAAGSAAMVWAVICATRISGGPRGAWPSASAGPRVSYCPLNGPCPPAHVGPGMPGIDGIALLLLAVSAGALGVMLIATAALALSAARHRGNSDDPPARERRRAFRPYAGGMTTPLAASVATFIGVGYAAAFCLGAQQVLSLTRSVATTLLHYPTRPRPFVLPPILERTAYAWGLTVIVIVALVLVVVIEKVRRGGRFRAAADALFTFVGTPATARMPDAQRTASASAMYLARLKNLIPLIFGVFATVGLVLTAAAALEEYANWSTVLGIGWLSATYADTGQLTITWLGVGALIGLALALFLLARGAVGSENSRRGLNVVWDVISFWPRSVHPLVPAAYSQFVVADLRRRISYLLAQNPDTRLALAGHSQGSLISLTTLLWLPPAERGRVGLVTFGSQIRIMFSRAFPQYVNADVVDWAMTQYAGRWCNLFRDTDPLAGPVLSWDHRSVTEHDAQARTWTSPTSRQVAVTASATGARRYDNELQLLDPAVSPEPVLMTSAPTMRKHSDYPADPDWPIALQIAGMPV